MQRQLQDLAETTLPIADDPKADASALPTISDVDLLRLRDRVAQASFEQAYPELPDNTRCQRQPTNLHATLRHTPWTSEESTHDSVLRMLTDKHKPLRTPKPTLSSLPLKGAKRSFTKTSTGRALAAKEASQGYSLLKEKLSPGFHAMPATMEGLASLAEERIQDALARGEFSAGTRKTGSERPPRRFPYLDRTGILHSHNSTNTF
jgi:hypothetical protein